LNCSNDSHATTLLVEIGREAWLGYRAGNWLEGTAVQLRFYSDVPVAAMVACYAFTSRENFSQPPSQEYHPLFSGYFHHSMMAEMNFNPTQKCPLGRGSQ
jgi:hypothetical protein